MTREEAISVLEESKRQNEIMRDNPNTFFKVSDIVTGEKNAQKRIDALNMAISALRQQEPNDWICTLKCTALMDEGMCSHGGLYCLYESQRTLKENQPLTLDELRKMDKASEPVYLYIFRSDIDSGWQIIEQITDRKIIFRGSMGIYVPIKELGVSYNLYRQKPEEALAQKGGEGE